MDDAVRKSTVKVSAQPPLGACICSRRLSPRCLQVEDLFTADPEGLALRLSSKGAVGAALEVVRAAGLQPSLRHELQARQLAHLVGGAVAQGAGPAAALRYLRDLPQEGDAAAVVTGALPLLGRIKDKSLLVRNKTVTERR